MIYGLIAVIAILLVAVWMRHREASAIAYSMTEFLKERLREADVERDRLLTRLQQFEPPRPEPPPPPKSQADVRQEFDAPKEYTDGDLSARGLVRNGDGTVVEGETGRRWASPQDYDDWIALKAEKGLPDDADPLDWQGRE